MRVAALTPTQRRRREEIEGLIRVAEPFLNLVLAVGERISRVMEREDYEYYPPRSRRLSPSEEEPAQTRSG